MNVIFLIITDENPMDLYDVQKLCNELKLDRAMAFDGGSSTSIKLQKTKLKLFQLLVMAAEECLNHLWLYIKYL